jgi:acyl-CoA synthetase (NDP forming)
MLATAPAEDYERAITAVGRCDEVDAMIVIFIPPLVTRAEDVAAALRAAVDDLDRRVPVLAVFMSHLGAPQALREGEVHVPSYAFPEDAARALARAARYAEWRRTPASSTFTFEDVGRTDAASVIAAALADGRGWLEAEEVASVLGCYGIPLVEWRLAQTAGEAREAATELGGEVALKAVAPGLLHKTDSGGVRLGLSGDNVEGAAAQMARTVGDAGHPVEGFIVQRMAPAGEEMLVGVVGDPVFGPVVACGAGGVTTELLNDVVVRITPLTVADARDMVRSLRTFPLLDGYRGRPKANVPALEEMLLRASALVDAHAEIAEMDLNPVIVNPSGAVALDARIRIEPASPRRPWPALD